MTTAAWHSPYPIPRQAKRGAFPLATTSKSTTPQQLARIASFIWGIADDVLRDLYVRGKYRDVILPMTVLRRLDAVLEPTKQAVLDMKASLDEAGIINQDAAAAPGRRPGLLQHLEVHAARPAGPRQPAAAQGRLRGLPRRLLAERPGDPRQLRVPQPDPAALEGRRARHADREVPRPDDQPQPEPGAERRRLGQAPRPRQPRDGHDLRGAGPPLQRGEQRGGGRALDAARRRQADGEADLPADRRPDRVRHLPALRRRLRHRRHAHRRRGDAAASSPRSTASRSPPTSTARRSTPRPTPSARPTCCSRARARRRTTSSAARSTRRSRTTPSRRASSTSCSRIRPTARAGRATSSAWAARTASRTRASSSSTPATPSTRSSPAPATARCCSWPTCSRKMKHDTPLGSRIAEVHNGSLALHRRRRPGREQHPPLDHRERLARGDRRPAAEHVLQHRHRHLHLGAHQPQARAPPGKVQLIDATQWFKPLRKNLGKKNCELSDDDIQRICDDVPRLRGDRAVEDLPERRLRLLEGHRRAAAAPRGHRPGPRLHAEGDQGAQGDGRARRGRAAGDPEDPQAGRRRRSAARPVRGDHRRQARRRRVRARQRPARHRAGAAARGGRHRGVHATRGAAATRRTPGTTRTSVKIGYEISFTRYFYKPQPLRRSRRSAPTSWRWSGRPKGCCSEIVGGAVAA